MIQAAEKPAAEEPPAAQEEATELGRRIADGEAQLEQARAESAGRRPSTGRPAFRPRRVGGRQARELDDARRRRGELEAAEEMVRSALADAPSASEAATSASCAACAAHVRPAALQHTHVLHAVNNSFG